MTPTDKSKLKVGDLVRLSRNRITGDRSYCESEYKITKLSKGNTHATLSNTDGKSFQSSRDIFLDEYDVFKQNESVLDDLTLDSTVTFACGGIGVVKHIEYLPQGRVSIMFETMPYRILYEADGSSRNSLLTIVEVENISEFEKLLWAIAFGETDVF